MDETLEALGWAVKQLQWRHERAAGARLAEIGLSLPQWNLLRQVELRPRSSLRDLAQHTFQTEQGAGALAARMIDKGMLERVPGGGRAVHLLLTRAGEQLLVEGTEIMYGMLAWSFADLDDRGRSALLALLDTVLSDGSADDPIMP